jgi:hypothetical protein
METADAGNVRGIERSEDERRPVCHQSGRGTAPKAPTKPFFSVGQKMSRTKRTCLLGDDDSSRWQRLLRDPAEGTNE